MESLQIKASLRYHRPHPDFRSTQLNSMFDCLLFTWPNPYRSNYSVRYAIEKLFHAPRAPYKIMLTLLDACYFSKVEPTVNYAEIACN